MKPILTAAKKPGAVVALKSTVFILFVYALVDFAAQYILTNQLYTEAIGAELDRAETVEPSHQAAVFMGALMAYVVVSLIVNVIAVVVAYRVTFAKLRKSSLTPRLHADTTSGLVLIASLVSCTVSYLLGLTLPYSDINMNTSVTSIIISFALMLLFIAMSVILVRHFAYKRAVREKEELFS